MANVQLQKWGLEAAKSYQERTVDADCSGQPQPGALWLPVLQALT